MSPLDPTVVVIGAGPAGLAAAHALARAGVRGILVLDRDDEPGGLPRFCRHPGFGWEYTHRLETGPGFARRLLSALDPEIVTVTPRTTALGVQPGPEIEIVGAAHGHQILRPRAVILATGIRERPRSARLVPGRRPERGILTTGQLQQMVARGVKMSGQRAVVVGTEHVAFSVLLTARHAGLEIVAMIGAEDRVMSYAGAGWAARLMGVPIHLSSEVADIKGSAHVEAAIVRGPGGTHAIDCDTVIFTGDFVPDAAMLHGIGAAIDPRTGGPVIDQYGRTSTPGVFAAGNLLRAVESSGLAAIEGASVGANAATYLHGALDWPTTTTPIQLGGDLDYLVPQIWAPNGGNGARALPISVRSQRDVARARLRLSDNGVDLWLGKPVGIMRKRRVALPATAFDSVRASSAAALTLDVL